MDIDTPEAPGPTDEVTRNLSGPVHGIRWNVKDGAFVLQVATDAVVFDGNGQYQRMEVIWQDVPIVDNAPKIEPATNGNIKQLAPQAISDERN